MESLPVATILLPVIIKSPPLSKDHLFTTALLVTMKSLPGLLESLPVDNKLLPIIMRSLWHHFLAVIEVTSCFYESLPVYNSALPVTMATLSGLLESLRVENRLLPVIMRSLPVSRSHFLFTIEHFRLQ